MKVPEKLNEKPEAHETYDADRISSESDDDTDRISSESDDDTDRISSESDDDTGRISSESDDDTLCGFSGIAHRSPLSNLKDDWIQCQLCRIWHREKCVAAGRRKMFAC
jgi:hypothetical protein